MIAPASKRATRTWIAGAVLLALAVAAAADPLPKAWTNWRYWRPIELPATDSVRLAGLSLPQDVYLRAKTSLPDIRLIDDAGNEVPFARYAREGSTISSNLPTEILENSFSRGDYTQVVVNLGESAPFHNAVEIHTGESDFIEWVSIEASDDAHQWRTVEERAPIFRFQQQNREGTQTVRYSPNNARYLRIRVLDGEKKFPIDSAQVFSNTVEAPERSFLDESIVDEPTGQHAGENSWRVDMGTPALGLQEVRFAVNPAEFIRAVNISVSDDGNDWRPVAHGEIYRFLRDSTAEEHLRVDVPGDVTGRYWRITVVNGNDAPLPGVIPSLYITPVHIVFEQQPGRSYRLIYGQSRATAPQYDLARRINAEQEDVAGVGQLGAEQETSNYADPRPWTEKNRYLMWVAMGLAVLLLGYSAVRSLRRDSKPAA
jgi:Protein of unknown function (DUF3999)